MARLPSVDARRAERGLYDAVTFVLEQALEMVSEQHRTERLDELAAYSEDLRTLTRALLTVRRLAGTPEQDYATEL